MEKGLLFIGIVLLIFAANKLKQDLFSPAVINIYWNSLFLIGGVILFGGDLVWDFSGIFWIYLSMVVFLVGQLIGNQASFAISKKEEKKISNMWPLGISVLVILGFGSSYFFLKAYGYEVRDLLQYEALIEINGAIAYDRYNGNQIGTPTMSVLLNTISYATCLCGGYLWNYTKKKRWRVLTLCSILPILLQTTINNAKVGFIASIFLWATGWMISYLRTRRKSMKLTFKVGLTLLILAVLGIGLLDIFMLLRIGKIDWATQKIVNQKMLIYAFGQIHSFSVWFSQRESIDLDLGVNTFMAVADLLGLTEREPGIYEFMEEATSNIFTQYRGLIADFGVIGAQVYCFMQGMIGAIAYKRVISGADRTRVSVVILAAILFSILYGFIISPWVYTSYILAFVGFGCVLFVLKYFKVSIRK